ncbi:MAG: YraN family protein [Candidatus Nomurabacteria bacterium]|nr:MAG: YraN family protein [Candidatus Nomurabacteria bacterium]
MTNYSTGHYAEQVASQYLKGHGYQIIETNWKTPKCEIDVVAKQNGAIYFFEVKYRRTHNQGAGLDYITSKKLSQMAFSAEMWVQTNNWRGDYQLGAIEMSGEEFQIDNVVLDIYGNR